MTPMFSSATVSQHTYNFWTSKSAQYISLNNINIVKNINTSQENKTTKNAQNNK